MADNIQKEKRIAVQNGSSASNDRINYRRREMIKGAAKAMPMILTLQSGAALAGESSGPISTTSAPESTAIDADGNMLCLDTTYAKLVGNGKYYNLGDPGIMEISSYRADLEYRSAPNYVDSSVLTNTQVCEAEAPCYWTTDGVDFQALNLPPNGVLISSGARASFEPVIYNNYTNTTEI